LNAAELADLKNSRLTILNLTVSSVGSYANDFDQTLKKIGHWDEQIQAHPETLLKWRRAAETEGRVMLAGRLAADNVREAIERVRPWAVDASSRLETEPGVKDHDAVHAFVEAAR